MRKCKCISNKLFIELGNDDYNVFIGEIYQYLYINYLYVQILDLKDNTIIFLTRKHYNESFVDLIEYRKQKISKLLCANVNV